LNHGKGKVYKQVMSISGWEIHVNKLDNEQLAAASPDGILKAKKKPSSKAIESLKDWRDEEAESQLKAELLDGVVRMLKDEVNN